MNILSDSSRWGIFSLIIGLSAVTELKLFVLNLSAVLMNLASFVVIKMISEKQISLFFNFLGKISFELFLVHGALMYSYDIILFRFPLYFSFFLYLGFIIFLSYLLNKLFGVLSRQLLSVQMKPISASCTII
jgi:peptidoglycan/LPS O-acetylase OafA/YrhL